MQRNVLFYQFTILFCVKDFEMKFLKSKDNTVVIFVSANVCRLQVTFEYVSFFRYIINIFGFFPFLFYWKRQRLFKVLHYQPRDGNKSIVNVF